MPCSLRGRPPWIPSRPDMGSSQSREPSGPSRGSLVKRDAHSPVASLPSFVDDMETMDRLQEKITDLASFKLAPVTTVYATSRPVPPPPSPHYRLPPPAPFPRSVVENTVSKCATGPFFPKPGSPLSAPLHLANSSLIFRLLDQESFGYFS